MWNSRVTRIILFQNENEVEACLLLIKELEEKNKDYRIISPYAPQTDLILRRLKEENLPWEDKCFNVDAFQGNEADYIIISLVRTVRNIQPFWCFTVAY
jgi:regulator of nonsense transcripts 1